MNEEGTAFYDRSIGPLIQKMINDGKKSEAIPRGH
jgi:hypothetical protein